jgi:hypothetical protein
MSEQKEDITPTERPACCEEGAEVRGRLAPAVKREQR